jgi:hypothetical protein
MGHGESQNVGRLPALREVALAQRLRRRYPKGALDEKIMRYLIRITPSPPSSLK